MEKISYYTVEGLQKLTDKLHTLKTDGRAEVAKQLAEARAQGDLRENAEYDAAKEAQWLLETKISKLERTVAFARVISKADIDPSRICILSKVKVKHKKQGTTFSYSLVSEAEADLNENEKKISVDSPMGKGLLGKRIGDTVVIDVPAGKIELEVLDIKV